MIKPPFAPAPRPDPLDIFVLHWLQGAVSMAHLMTAPFQAMRGTWSETADRDVFPALAIEGAIPEGMDAPSGPSLVSPIRHEDAPHLAPGSTETCADCRFYRAANAQAGECRRFAPGVAEDTDRAFWPLVTGQDGCGEFFPALTGLTPVH